MMTEDNNNEFNHIDQRLRQDAEDARVQPPADLEEKIIAQIRETQPGLTSKIKRTWMFRSWMAGIGMAAALAIVIFLYQPDTPVRTPGTDNGNTSTPIARTIPIQGFQFDRPQSTFSVDLARELTSLTQSRKPVRPSWFKS